MTFFRVRVSIINKRVQARADSRWNIDQTLAITA